MALLLAMRIGRPICRIVVRHSLQQQQQQQQHLKEIVCYIKSANKLFACIPHYPKSVHFANHITIYRNK